MWRRKKAVSPANAETPEKTAEGQETPGTEKTAGGPLRVLKYKHRQGFETRGMRWVYRILYPYFHCRVRLPRELRESDEPVVFIANHYNVFGPISFVMSMPVVSNIWINEELITPECASAALRPGLQKMLPFLNEKQNQWLCGRLGRLAVKVLSRFGAIPVNRNDPSKLISTMRQSLKALQEGRNLLIFPETGLPEYSLTSVTPFYSAFATIGRLYYRKTGRALRFCPCYIDEQHHQIRLGETVVWNPDNEPGQETERVSDELNLRIRTMAAESRGVEKEKAGPVRQSVLFFCNLLRTALLIPLVTMLGLGNTRMILLFYGLTQALRILFNGVCNYFAASNRISFLYSHGLGILTDLSVLIHLTGGSPRLGWLVLALVLNGAVILISNAVSVFRYRRCAGLNYFDTLGANLICLICLQQLLKIPLRGLFLGILVLATILILVFSGGSAVAFNARIGREEMREEAAA